MSFWINFLLSFSICLAVILPLGQLPLKAETNVSLSNKKSLIYAEQGLVNLLLENDNAALRNFNQAIALNQTNKQAYFNQACMYQKKSKYHKAIVDLSKLLQLSPQDAEVYASRGWLYHQIGLEELAIKDFKLALKYSNEQNNQENYQRILAQFVYLQQLIVESHQSLSV